MGWEAVLGLVLGAGSVTVAGMLWCYKLNAKVDTLIEWHKEPPPDTFGTEGFGTLIEQNTLTLKALMEYLKSEQEHRDETRELQRQLFITEMREAIREEFIGK